MDSIKSNSKKGAARSRQIETDPEEQNEVRSEGIDTTMTDMDDLTHEASEVGRLDNATTGDQRNVNADAREEEDGREHSPNVKRARKRQRTSPNTSVPSRPPAQQSMHASLPSMIRVGHIRGRPEELIYARLIDTFDGIEAEFHTGGRGRPFNDATIRLDQRWWRGSLTNSREYIADHFYRIHIGTAPAADFGAASNRREAAHPGTMFNPRETQRPGPSLNSQIAQNPTAFSNFREPLPQRQGQRGKAGHEGVSAGKREANKKKRKRAGSPPKKSMPPSLRPTKKRKQVRRSIRRRVQKQRMVKRPERTDPNPDFDRLEAEISRSVRVRQENFDFEIDPDRGEYYVSASDDDSMIYEFYSESESGEESGSTDDSDEEDDDQEIDEPPPDKKRKRGPRKDDDDNDNHQFGSFFSNLTILPTQTRV